MYFVTAFNQKPHPSQHFSIDLAPTNKTSNLQILLNDERKLAQMNFNEIGALLNGFGYFKLSHILAWRILRRFKPIGTSPENPVILTDGMTQFCNVFFMVFINRA